MDSGVLAWPSFDPYNEFRLAVAALSGGFLTTMYAENCESVRLERRKDRRILRELGFVNCLRDHWLPWITRLTSRKTIPSFLVVW